MLRSQARIITVVLAATIFAYLGCARHTIVTEIRSPIPAGKGLSIGVIENGLPLDASSKDKPLRAEIDYFKKQLAQQIGSKAIFAGVLIGHNKPDYELTGSLVGYKGGVFRSLSAELGMSPGKVTVSLTLKEVKSGETVFSGTFTNSAHDGYAEITAFRELAKDFAKSLKKSLKKEARYVD